jgi:amino acid transporter
MSAATEPLTSDERLLEKMGYKPELNRGWSAFSNFAISMTIICILSGCLTTYGQAWNYGGPIGMSIGWPVISILVLMVGFSMAELASKFPTAGGIYYWAHQLGGPRWAWFTGWFNLLGLVAIIAAVDYGAASFLNSLLALYDLHFIVDFGTSSLSSGLHHSFELFVLILLVHGLINVFSSPLVALLNRISVWWITGGVIAIVAILIFGPAHHQSAAFVFEHRINNSGFTHGMYWFFILPIGFLLTMYTFTGYDASAHISEETHNAALAAPQGIWRSIAWSALAGWVVLLSITFAATHVNVITAAGGGAVPVITSALSSGLAKLVLWISVVAQLFCGMGCVAASSRMAFAFSRDRAIPGHSLWRRLNRHKTPTWSVLLVGGLALLITIPAWFGDKAGLPVAFFAVTSITAIGLYIAYAIPIYLRWRMGDAFEPGPWTLGAKYKWINLIAILWVVLCVIIFCLPTSPGAVPWNHGFSFSLFNYAPVVTLGLFLAVLISWELSAKHWFTGPIRTIDEVGVAPDRTAAPAP